MSKPERIRVAALDGGTTNTRARLIEGDRVIATARRPVGVKDAALGDPKRANPIVVAIRECLEELDESVGGLPPLIVASGMLSSEAGLSAVPHVVAPASIDDLAAAAELIVLPDAANRGILLIPGVRTPAGPGPDGWTEADVMRGEECETFGATSSLESQSISGRLVFLWPGSHTKLVQVDELGRITRSFTTLAGEITSAVANHTLPAVSLPKPLPREIDLEAADLAFRVATKDGLGRAAFLIRVADLLKALGPPERASFWIAAVIAEDAARLASCAMLQGRPTVVIGGSRPQRGLYRRFLGRLYHGPLIELDETTAESCSARGAVAVALRRASGEDRGIG